MTGHGQYTGQMEEPRKGNGSDDRDMHMLAQHSSIELHHL
jgi:hypothetical protein